MDCQKASEPEATGAAEAAGEAGAASSRSADATWCLCPSFVTPSALSRACNACAEKQGGFHHASARMAPSRRDQRQRAPEAASRLPTFAWVPACYCGQPWPNQPLGLRAGWHYWVCSRPAAANQPGHIGRALDMAQCARGSSAVSSCSSASSWAERPSHTACGRPSGASFVARQHPAARAATLASSDSTNIRPDASCWQPPPKRTQAVGFVEVDAAEAAAQSGS